MAENLIIKTYEDACMSLGISSALPDTIKMLPKDLRIKIINNYKLTIITHALNGDWQADYKDPNQYKYYPWFFYNNKPLSDNNTYVLPLNAASNFGAPFVCRDAETALYLGQQFLPLFKDLLI